MKPSVLITRRWPTSVEKSLAEQFNVTLNSEDVPYSTEQFRQALTEHDAVLTTVTDKLGKEMFDALNPQDVKTRIIGNYGVGFSHIDLDSANRLGITVTNTPDVLSECTADIAIMLLLMIARRGGEAERELRAGNWTGWRPTHMIGAKVSGRTLGIVGFGRIGRETAKRALGFGMKVCIFNRSKVADQVLSEFNAVQIESLEELAAGVDFVSLHCPGGAENTHMINTSILDAMKPTAFLINTARGEVIDEAALIKVLESRSIAGAGLDVYQNEPAINPGLLKLDNVVLLPHLGSATDDTRDAMGYRVMENITAFFNNQQPADKVV